MPDAVDASGGAATTGRYDAYDRFDAGGRHRACRARHPRETGRPAGKHGGAVPPEVKHVRRELHGDRGPVFHAARSPDAHGAHSARLRSAMDRAMQDVPGEYRARGGDGPGMIRVPDRLERQMPRMFALLEHPGVDPTSNASGRALRHTVVLRRIIRQTRGSPGAMGPPADFVTCVLTWRRQGRSVYEEVARLI